MRERLNGVSGESIEKDNVAGTRRGESGKDNWDEADRKNQEIDKINQSINQTNKETKI